MASRSRTYSLTILTLTMSLVWATNFACSGTALASEDSVRNQLARKDCIRGKFKDYYLQGQGGDPPGSYTGRVFKLSQDYPSQLSPMENYPWLKIDFKNGGPVDPRAYLQALLNYGLEGNIGADFYVEDNKVRKWYGMPWMDWNTEVAAVAMAVAVPLRCDFDAAQLRALAKRSRDPDQTRRLLALAAIYDGASRTEAAQIGCVTLQIVRDWVLRFNARGPEGLRTGRAPGAPPRLTDAHRAALVARVDAGPIPAIHGVVRWRLIDLIQWLWEEFRLSISKQTLSRELRAMNYRKLSARPRHHAKNEAAVAAFKKTSRPVWRRSGRRSAASP